MPNPAVRNRSPLNAIPIEHLEPIHRATMMFDWKGVRCVKNPFDLAIYMRLIWRERPATIIEVGTHRGGSALFFADITRCYGLETRIISIDIKKFDAFSDSRIEFLEGDSNCLEKTLTDDLMSVVPRPLLVVEDASHLYEPTLASLRFFDRWMQAGELLVAEDGIIDSLDLEEQYDGGPNRAIAEFLSETGDRYQIAKAYCDYFGPNVIWNTNGCLRRRRDKSAAGAAGAS